MDSSLPPDPSVDSLLAEVERTFGPHAERCDPALWVTLVSPFCARLQSTAKDLLFAGAEVIGERALSPETRGAIM